MWVSPHNIETNRAKTGFVTSYSRGTLDIHGLGDPLPEAGKGMDPSLPTVDPERDEDCDLLTPRSSSLIDSLT